MVLSDSDVHSFLEIKNVSHAYGHKPALENVSLDAQKSEVLALLGPSGSGKSTLAAHLERALYQRRIHTMFLDSAGISGAIAPRLRGLGYENVIEINFGADSPEDKYYNKRAYMWGKLKDWLLSGAIPDDERLEADLTGPGFHLNKQDRLVLESKESMAKRGLASPDDGDALSLTFAQPVKPRVVHAPAPLPRGAHGWLGT